MNTLDRKISLVGFVEREVRGGQSVHNKCGRDFLYYCLNFYFPEQFNPHTNNPLEIDRKHLFGKPMPAWLAWTQIQFAKVPAFLERLGLRLIINSRIVDSYLDFIQAILFSRMLYKDAIQTIEKNIDNNVACGVDFSLGWWGLLDHVLFVYGYDENNLYVFDTHYLAKAGYESMSDRFHYYKLPKAEVEKRWTRFGRVWQVLKK